MRSHLRPLFIVLLLVLSMLVLALAPAVRSNGIVISSDTILTGDVDCTDFTVNPSVTVTTDGASIICSGTFNNQGTIVTGVQSNGGAAGVASCCHGPGGAGGGGASTKWSRTRNS